MLATVSIVLDLYGVKSMNNENLNRQLMELMPAWGRGKQASALPRFLKISKLMKRRKYARY
jgi:hypothetical protein